MQNFKKIKLFLFLLVLPTAISFNLGGLRLTPFRLLLLISFFPAYRYVSSLPQKKKDKADRFIVLFSLWAMVSYGVNHDLSVALESGGVFFLETVTPYMIARQLILNKELFDLLANFLIKLVVIMLVFLIPESITSFNVFGKYIYPIMGVNFYEGIDQRFGFTRSRGSFDHPIISGVFCSSMIGLAWFGQQSKKIKNTFFMVLATITSLSSGAIASIMTQFLVIGWDMATKNMKKRWLKLFILIVIAYFTIDLLSNRSGIKVIISYLTFSPATAYWRLLIWDFGIENVIDNPIFGIGFNDWERPSWMHSGSMDNFFLVIMVRHGFPAMFFLGFVILSLMYRLLMLKSIDERLESIKQGWLTGLVGLCISACTVHYWNQAYVFFTFYLGFGAALLKCIEETNGKG